MDSPADRVINLIQTCQARTFLPIIGPVKGKVLERIVKKEKPHRILEIGTLIGYSSILMAKHLDKSGKIYTIEIDKEAAEAAVKNIIEAKLQDKIEVIIGDAIKKIKNITEKFDVLFLDAGKEQYLKYLKLAEPKLKKGAIVVADNVKLFQSDMADYLEYVREGSNYRSRTIDFGQDGVEISIKLF